MPHLRASLCTTCLCVLTALSPTSAAPPAPPTTRPDISTLPIPAAAANAKGLDTAINKLHAPTRNTAPLSPQESQKHFKPAPGLAVDLIAAEPTVRQPLHITFDARGRLWVTQYIQYPIPNGLKIVEWDQYLRAKFDRVPPPPPAGPRGNDRIMILDDVAHDGSFSKSTVFVDGLNIATASLPDHDGAWVMNPPYLLFYPDKNHDDVPDGNPIVHLSGFGMQDTHSVASSLTWGPDGWLYGAHGSTVTSKIKIELGDSARTTDFLGQCIWRYHPSRHVFEIFAQGGGNTFGVAFDSKGHLYSGTNWGTYRGLHYVQGGYYIKSWGKHGPLTNPFAFGFFEHMPHTGDSQRLTHTFSIYDADLLPAEYRGKLLGPNPLQSRVQVTALEPVGSTYRTVELPPLLESTDGWFRPVDCKVGPDGAVYIADFYENRISHVDPRDTWDRSNGRLWRIRPADWKPGIDAFDLASATTDDLLKRLDSSNGWFRGAARKVLADRKDHAAIPGLLYRFAGDHQAGLDAFWALHAMGVLDEQTILAALDHRGASIRLWAIRFVGDDFPNPSPAVVAKLIELAANEADIQVRSQLASTAKRLTGDAALAVIDPMLRHDADAADPHIPMLLWWAMEDKAISRRDAILRAFTTTELWNKAIVQKTVLQRLARRWAAQPSTDNQSALLKLLHAAPGAADRKIIFAGIAEAFEGREIRDLLPELTKELATSGDLELALRAGDVSAHDEAIRLIESEEASLTPRRVKVIELLAQVGRPEDAAPLLAVVQKTKVTAVRNAAIAALGRFEEPSVGQQLAAFYPKLPADRATRAAAINVLANRASWAGSMLAGVEAKSIPKADLPTDVLDRLRAIDDPALSSQLERVYGRPKHSSSEEKEQEIARIRALVTSGQPGHDDAGKQLFTARCAACHTLFGQGGKIGPDLTPYDRRDVNFFLLNIVDPSIYIREEFTNFRIKTHDGRTLEGMITARDDAQITLTDQTSAKTIVPRVLIKDERALAASIMPEDLLAGLSDQELRDLFAYLMMKGPKK